MLIEEKKKKRKKKTNTERSLLSIGIVMHLGTPKAKSLSKIGLLQHKHKQPVKLSEHYLPVNN